jgi:hypothetical protein
MCSSPRRGTFIFPVLALVTFAVAVALPFRLSLIPLFLLMVAVNVAVRNATERDVRDVAGRFVSWRR